MASNYYLLYKYPERRKHGEGRSMKPGYLRHAGSLHVVYISSVYAAVCRAAGALQINPPPCKPFVVASHISPRRLADFQTQPRQTQALPKVMNPREGRHGN